MARLPYLVPYDPEFLGDGFTVPMPAPSCRGVLVQSGRVFDYIHYSLVMHRDRRTALFTAHNIDVSQRRSVPRTGWDLDFRLDREEQTGPGAYSSNPWDRGHLVRRAAVTWGSAQRAQDASDSTFYYTNAAPQHERFNQDEWLALEDWVLQAAGNIAPRLCVFTGPLYTVKDPYDGDVRIPSAFWKVVVLRDPSDDGDDLSALGFVMKQNEMWDDWNGSSLIDFRTFQVGIADIGGYTGLEFRELAELDEFEWRGVRFRDRTRLEPVPISGPGDIDFFGNRRRARGIRAPRTGAPPAEAGAVASHRRGSAGCPHCAGTLEDAVADLTQQVEALQHVVDTLLLEEGRGDDGGRRAAARQARQAYLRIVGGEAVGWGDYPECACIGHGQEWFCTGVLVAPKVVLTAAHCAPAIDKVLLGAQSVLMGGPQSETIDVKRVVVHPDYDGRVVPSHDIAVLVLDRPAATAPVEVATTAEMNGEDDIDLVGFGYDHPSLPVGFGTKRWVNVTLPTLSGMSKDQLESLERQHGFDHLWELFAGRKQLGKDTCNGDSGGPAYITVDGKRKVAAITSRAADSSVARCGDGGIYTRIAPYLPWIAEVTGGMVDAGGEAGGPGQPAAGRSGVYIAAVCPNPAGVDRGHEWVEIANGADQPVELEGAFIADRQGGRHPLRGTLAGRAHRQVVLPPDSPVKLGNSGDDVALLLNEVEVHRVSYPDARSGEVFRFDPPAGGGAAVEPQPFADADPC